MAEAGRVLEVEGSGFGSGFRDLSGLGLRFLGWGFRLLGLGFSFQVSKFKGRV